MKFFRQLSIASNAILPRKHRPLLIAGMLAAPSVLVLASIGVLAIVLSGPDARISAWYHQQALMALSNHEFSKARLCYTVLLQQSPDSPEYQYGLVISLAGMGENQAAGALVRQLAPEDGGGYLPAHVLMAEQILAVPNADEASLRLAESHLLHVIKAQPKDIKANALLASLYSRTGQWDLVKLHLPLGGPGVDAISLIAAQQFASRDDWTEAQIWARRASGYLANQLKGDPKNKDLRLGCAQAYLIMREFSLALDVLEAGWKLEELPVYRQAIAQVCGLWVRNSPTLDAPKRLSIIERGLTFDAQNSIVLRSLLDPATYEAAQLVLPSTVPVEGATARAIAECVDYCRKHDEPQVRSALELALALRPDLGLATAANLTCVWAFSEESDANSARLLATALLELRPNEAVAQRAMGLVLSRQKVDADAVRLLEGVLLSMPEDRAVHAALGASYERLGAVDKAKQHQKLGQPPATAPSTSPSK